MKRLRSIDIAKGVGIFLIVLFHCDVAHSFLFQFHVPFFRSSQDMFLILKNIPKMDFRVSLAV